MLTTKLKVALDKVIPQYGMYMLGGSIASLATGGPFSVLAACKGNIFVGSNDGEDWTGFAGPAITSASTFVGATSQVSGILWMGDKYVASCASGQVQTSANGKTWKTQSTGTTSILNSIAWSGTTLVAVGQSGTIITSPDGITWTTRTSGVTVVLYRVRFLNGNFLAVGASGTLLKSPDGITWTTVTVGPTSQFSDIAYGNSIYVIASYGASNNSYTSPDLVTWTARTSYTQDNYTILFAGGAFLLGCYPNMIFRSTDGINWTSVLTGGSTTLAAGAPRIQDFAYTGTFYVAAETQGTLATSIDGINWVYVYGRLGTSGQSLLSVDYTNSKYLVYGSQKNAYYSTDQISWTKASFATQIGTGVPNINKILWTGSIWYAGGTTTSGAFNSTLHQTSPDLVTWTNLSYAIPTVYDAATNGTTVVIVTSGTGTLVTYPANMSTNTVVTHGIGNFLRAIVRSSTLFVVVGSGGIIGTSTAGSTWTSRTSNTTNGLTSIDWSGSIYVAGGTLDAGGSTVIVTSPDAITWTVRSAIPGFSSLNFIRWTGTEFVAGGNTNASGSCSLMKSSNGISWTPYTTVDVGNEGTNILVGATKTYAVLGQSVFTLPSPTKVLL